MAQPRRRFGSWSLVLRTALAFLASACASAPLATAPRTAVRLEPPQSAPSGRATESLPLLPALSSGGAIAERPRRVKDLSVSNQPVALVIRELAEQFGLQYRIDPGVRGYVNTTLRNTTLTEALDAIIPQGVTYQIENGVLRVGPARIETRIFSMDYVALSRVGTASTIIQRRLGSSGSATGIGSASGALGAAVGIGSGSGNVSGGADIISAVSVADAWEEIRVTMEALIFDATPGGASNQQTAGSGPLGIGSVGRPFSRVTPDGRRLIINPMAGTITVSAFPAQLEQVEISIRSFEASIQRQVLIEAKIVEVNLDRSFEFGIDWNVVANSPLGGKGAIGVKVNSSTGATPATSNVEFTLSGGAGSITAMLNALDSQGDVRVLSSPRVSALNNQRAVFDVTTGEIVFNVTQTPISNPGGLVTFVSQVTPQQVSVGIVLDVLPQIGADNTVTMNIRPVVTSVRNTATFTGPDGTVFQAPVIDTRESDTMARLRAGETIIIGGLMQTRREKVQSGIPGLRSIPLLGRLFTSYRDVDRKAELVIFLTPTIISGQPVAGR
jgi:MSHA biogenesis protein MshL